MRSWLSGFVLLAALVGAGARAEAAERTWSVQLKLVSGTAPTCVPSARLVVREGDGKFRLLSPTQNFEIWSLPMAADGSVAGETVNAYNKAPVKVSVPAGTAARAFDVLDKSTMCGYRWDPV
jgi:hypothetical protein